VERRDDKQKEKIRGRTQGDCVVFSAKNVLVTMHLKIIDAKTGPAVSTTVEKKAKKGVKSTKKSKGNRANSSQDETPLAGSQNNRESHY